MLFLHEPIVFVTLIGVLIGGAALLAAITYFKTVSYTHLTLPTNREV